MQLANLGLIVTTLHLKTKVPGSSLGWCIPKVWTWVIIEWVGLPPPPPLSLSLSQNNKKKKFDLVAWFSLWR